MFPLFLLIHLAFCYLLISTDFSKELHSIQTIKGFRFRHYSSDVTILFIIINSCRQSTCVGSTAGSNIIVSASNLIYSSSVIPTEICANNSWDSASMSLFMIYISPTSNSNFLKHCLMASLDTIFQVVWSQVITFNMWTSSIIWEAIFPSVIRLTTSEQAAFCYLWIKFLMITA